jgi:hypothetical protein
MVGQAIVFRGLPTVCPANRKVGQAIAFRPLPSRMAGQAIAFRALPTVWGPGQRVPCPVNRMVGQAIAFRGLLGWAFGPRNSMKNGAGTLSGRSGLVGQLGKLRPIGNRPTAALAADRRR